MSAFFGARAPELVPESVRDLKLKPAHSKKMPLHERSSSEVNANRPTIRIVNPTSPPDVYTKSPFPHSSSQILRPSSPSKLRQQENLNYVAYPGHEQSPASSVGVGLVPEPLHLKSANRRGSASTTMSNADTVVADSLFSPTSARFSTDSCAKGTHPHHYTIENPAGPLEPLQERESSSSVEAQEQEQEQEQIAKPATKGPYHLVLSPSMNNSPYDQIKPPTPPKLRRRSSSSGLGFQVTREPSSSPERGLAGSSQESVLNTAQAPVQDKPSRPHNIIRYMSSTESIRPQYASVRPPIAPSRTGSGGGSGEDDEVIAPLALGRSRSTHMHSASLPGHSSVPRLDRAALSTITSDSAASVGPSSSQYEAETPPMTTQTWPRKRRTTVASSTYSDSVVSPVTTPVARPQELEPSSSYGSSVDSNDSALPKPLFSSSAPIPQKPFHEQPRHTGHSDEGDDTIGELQAPPLREKRSGYLVHKRSQSDIRPGSNRSNFSNLSNHSTAETNRWSVSTFKFPQWAFSFYSGRAGLRSANGSRVTLAGPGYASNNASRVTLAGPPYGGPSDSRGSLSRPASRARHGRSETINTFATRPASNHSNWETVYSESPASRFVPSIFRPRNRGRAQTDATWQTEREDTGDLGIYRIPADSSEPASAAASAPVTPTKPSKRSNVRNSRAQSQIPKQTIRNVTDGPTRAHGPQVPLSTDPSYFSFPHLIQNARLSRHLSVWRVPSIDEPFSRDILGRGNRQIVCFCLGFICPLLWMLAAFLPLPERPVENDYADESVWAAGGRNDSVVLGRGKERVAADTEWSWFEEKKYLKAKWWRTLNRIMSVIGVGIIAVIIALAVVAAKL
ncbi:hypothetical protein MBLNU457_2004t1 [Dothideomycetes sp. NU457]